MRAESSAVHRAGTVVVVGQPNVGKSTLFNRLLRTKLSIVSAKPQTTRYRILGVLTGEGYQAVFIDTPGAMRRTADELDRRMQGEVQSAVEEADVTVLLVEPRPPGQTERFLVGAMAAHGPPSLLAINKIDSVRKPALLPLIETYSGLHPFAEIVPISALTGDGVDLLLKEIFASLPEGEPLFPPDQLTDRTERFLAGELVREKVFDLYGDEVPYSTAVEVQEFREPNDAGEKTYIEATIYVERASQKAILIGKGGQALKQVGEAARREIEEMVGGPVYLQLWVKARPRWRKDQAFLKELEG
ncbi:MAG: GTPase Era [Chloroflexi bacterium]|nr:GTPase Era [Chloroflexota bacterium]